MVSDETGLPDSFSRGLREREGGIDAGIGSEHEMGRQARLGHLRESHRGRRPRLRGHRRYDSGGRRAAETDARRAGQMLRRSHRQAALAAGRAGADQGAPRASVRPPAPGCLFVADRRGRPGLCRHVRGRSRLPGCRRTGGRQRRAVCGRGAVHGGHGRTGRQAGGQRRRHHLALRPDRRPGHPAARCDQLLGPDPRFARVPVDVQRRGSAARESAGAPKRRPSPRWTRPPAAWPPTKMWGSAPACIMPTGARRRWARVGDTAKSSSAAGTACATPSRPWTACPTSRWR